MRKFAEKGEIPPPGRTFGVPNKTIAMKACEKSLFLSFVTAVLLLGSCSDDERVSTDGASQFSSLRLLSASDAAGCDYLVYTRTREHRGIRPLDFDQVGQLPRVLTHRLVPLTEEWETEVCYTPDGKRALRRRRLPGAKALNPTALAYEPAPVDEVFIAQDGSATNYSNGEVVGGYSTPAIGDTSTYALFRDYRRLPKDSFLLAMGMLRDSLAERTDYDDLSIEVLAEVVRVNCNLPGFTSTQIVDAELQIPRITVTSGSEPGAVTKTLLKASPSADGGYPVLERSEIRSYLAPQRTADVPMYTFLETEYLEYSVETPQ